MTENGRFELAGVYTNKTNYSFSAAKWSIAGAYQQRVSDTVTIAVGAQFWDEVGFRANEEQFTVGANLDWTPVNNFLVRARVQYKDNSASGDTTTGYLRFERSF